MQLVLDMDGVITDFVGAAHTIHNRSSLIRNGYPYPHGKYDWYIDDPRWSDLSIRDFWRPMGEHFWEHVVEWDVGGRSRLREAESVFGRDNIVIVTGPPPCLDSGTKIVGSVRGKWKWIIREMPNYSNQVIFTHEKHWLARPGRVLWDDSPENVRRFREAGGNAVLIEQPWNT